MLAEFIKVRPNRTLSEKNRLPHRHSADQKPFTLPPAPWAGEMDFHALAETLPTLVFVADPHGNCLYTNAAFQRYAGTPAHEIVFGAWLNVIHPADVPRMREAWSAGALTSPPHDVECRLRAANGDYRWFHARGAAVREGGNILRWIVSCSDIDDRKRWVSDAEHPVATPLSAAEARFRTRTASEFRLRRLLDSGIIGVGFGDATGRVTYVNDAFLRMIGRTRADNEADAINWRVLTAPEYAPRDAVAIEHMNRTGSSLPYEKEYILPHGRLPVQITMALIDPADPESDHVAVIVDLTHQKAAQQKLAESEARFRAMMDAMPQIVWSAGPDGVHDYYNRRWYEFTGMPEGADDDTAWCAVVHPDDHARVKASWQQSLASGSPYEIEQRLRHHSGTYGWMLSRALPVRDPAGAIIRWMGTSTDLQELIEARDALAHHQTELEQRVADRTEALRRANARLLTEMGRRERAQAALVQSQKLEALGQLTASVAHDFNNAIAAISGAFSIIERRTIDPRILDIARHGVKAADRGNALVQQILLFAREQKLSPANVQLPAFFAETMPLIRGSLGSGIALAVACPGDIAAIHVDPVQLEAALINLAVNARDAMPDGGTLTLTAVACPATAPGRPSELADDDAVELCMADTGIGMPPDVLQRVIEPFFTTKGIGRGTGLGLAMVHRFVQSAGGALRISSVVGAGTTISLFLPQASGKMLDQGREPDAETGAATDSHRGAILLVDDDEPVRSVMAAQLADFGYDVIEAEDGPAALQALENAVAVDIVLADAIMPGMSGPEMATAMRARRPGLPIVFMTGHADRSQLGGEAVIEKPFTPNALAEHLLAALRATHAQALIDEDTLNRLEARLRSPTLRPALQRWRNALKSAPLPRFADFYAGDDVAANLVVVDVDCTRLPVSFRIAHIGASLARAAGTAAKGSELPVVGSDMLGSQEAAYRRCVRSRRPSYEYARYELGDGRPVLFERLLLPFTVDGVSVTKLVCIAVIDGSPAEIAPLS